MDRVAAAGWQNESDGESSNFDVTYSGATLQLSLDCLGGTQRQRGVVDVGLAVQLVQFRT
jgi:hypothetical protein